jgi:hypothetical protein
MDYCCEGMERQFEVDSEDERLIFFAKEIEEYGLIDRKDPSGYVPIAFCPWCGKDILSPRFKALEKKRAIAKPRSANEENA